MANAEADSILSRGGNLRLTPTMSARLGSVLAPLGLIVVASTLGSWNRQQGLVLVLVGVVLAAVVFAIHLRSFVTVVGSTLRWRNGLRTREVSLEQVDLPRRTGSSFNDRLVVPVAGRDALSLYARSWGAGPLDSLERRLVENARVLRPRARAAGRGGA